MSLKPMLLPLWTWTMACVSGPRPDSEVKEEPLLAWPIAAPAEVGLDPTRLEAMTVSIQSGVWGNIHAIVIARSGQLAYEAYFEGEDETIDGRYGRTQFGPDTRHDLRSISKSFTAALVGIARDRGNIESVDERLSVLLPGAASTLHGGREEITLRHLLTMTAGLAWTEGSASEEDDQDRLANSSSPVTFVLGRELEATPGERFLYSGGLTQLMVPILEEATGAPFLEFAQSTLFAPLGIEDWEWLTLGSAAPSAFSGLRLRARDMAKLGQMFLNGGTWRGNRIVSEDWIRESLTPYTTFDEPGAPEFIVSTGYGFQWWFDVHQLAGRRVVAHSATGTGGQRIILIPELELVVATFGGLYEDAAALWNPEMLVREHVLPAISG